MQSISESAWSRARRDTEKGFHAIRFWAFELSIIGAFTIWVLLWQPTWASKEWPMIVYQVLVPLASVFAGLALILFVSLIIAPYRQRNELRVHIESRLTTIPPGPEIQVALTSDENYRQLYVTNLGDVATFTALAKKIQPGELGSEWPIKWRGSYQRARRLLQGESAYLDVVSEETNNRGSSGKNLVFHTARQEVEPSQTSISQGISSYVDSFPDRWDESIVSIQIFADPPLNRSFERRYRIFPDTDNKLRMEPWPY